MAADLYMNSDDVLNPATLHVPLFPAGVIRTTVEDFEVEEIPAYLPEGSGEHRFLWIEKRGLAAGELISRLSRILRVRSMDIGVAGQKDRHAVTRQFVSVPATCELDPERLGEAGIKVLSSTLHRNKLRTGHLQGNRFRIVVRNPDSVWNEADCDLARRRLDELAVGGFPSYYGPQRFGHDGNTLNEGLAFLKGQLTKRHWPQSQQLFMKRMVLSAVQSAVFNLVVSERVRQQTVATPLIGDVVIRRNGTRPFLWTGEAPAPSDDSMEIERYLPAGPMVGGQMVASEGAARQLEFEALNCLGLTGDEFLRHAKLCSGARRIMLEFPETTSVQLKPEGHLQFQFELRSGTYATVLLRELFESVRSETAEQP